MQCNYLLFFLSFSFQSIPEVMGYDQTYPLPDESNCIRRGGNGEIFIGNYSGITFAIKKTTFRMREFTILTKLHHKNIMPLLLMMMGEQHPVHKRRYFCYHFMPRMTGDCARMITDHKKYTMKELIRHHKDNPRYLGTVQGNLRYLLAEVLRGLSYLHSMHIVHRDIKGTLKGALLRHTSVCYPLRYKLLTYMYNTITMSIAPSPNMHA